MGLRKNGRRRDSRKKCFEEFYCKGELKNGALAGGASGVKFLLLLILFFKWEGKMACLFADGTDLYIGGN